MTDRSSQAGSMSLELVLLAPVMIALLLLLAVGGRLAETRIAVQGAARSAARSASLQRDIGDAVDAAKDSGEASLKDRDLTCEPMNIVTDTSRFSAPNGAGVVTVSVECTVGLADFGVLSVPASRLVRAEFSEPIDRFREVTVR